MLCGKTVLKIRIIDPTFSDEEVEELFLKCHFDEKELQEIVECLVKSRPKLARRVRDAHIRRHLDEARQRHHRTNEAG